MIFDNLKNVFFLKPLQIRKKSVPLHSQSETMPNGVVFLVRNCRAGKEVRNLWWTKNKHKKQTKKQTKVKIGVLICWN